MGNRVRGMLQVFVVLPAAVFILITLVTAAQGEVGKKLWEKSYGASVGDDYSFGVAIDSSGNVISVGKLYSFDGGFVGSSGHAVQYDEAGNLVTTDWPIIVDPVNPLNKTSFRGVAIDSEGNLLFAGNSSLINGTFTAWKFPAAGGQTATWTKTLLPAKGGFAYDIWAETGGGSSVVGFITDPEGHGTAEDWTVVKYAADGTQQPGFPQYYDHASGTANHIDAARNTVTDSQGNLIVVGQVGIDGTNTDNYDHAWHVRTYTAAGSDEGGTTFDLTSLADVAYGVAVDAQDNIYVVGGQNSGTDNGAGANFDWVIKKLSGEGGSELWSQSYRTDENEIAYCLAVDEKNNIYVGGYSTDGSGESHWRLEYRSGATGALLKEKTWESLPGSTIRAITLRGDKLALTGDYSNGSDLDWYTALYDVYSFPWAMFQAAMSGSGKE